jgi:hypothetical protein
MKKLSIIIFLFGLFSLAIFGQKTATKIKTETEFLEQFVGIWVGEGKSLECKTTDEMTFTWIFEKKFLKMNYRTLEGKDVYTSEGFIWFNPKKKLFEYYDFNDGIWAVRKGLGKLSGNSLLISEQREEDGTIIELSFEFINQNTLKVVEFITKNQTRQNIADYTFKKKIENDK